MLMRMTGRCKHLLTVLLLFGVLFITISGALKAGTDPLHGKDPYEKYGAALVIFMYILRMLTIVPLPIALSNFLGVVFGNTFPDTPKLVGSLSVGPVCFRVVTRGTYPELVKRNVKSNIQVCHNTGLTDFFFEIVTDHPMSIGDSAIIREIVVPSSYKTFHGSLYKARALQYALESDQSNVRDQDWIVHLDEETLLTQTSVAGITQFIQAGTYEFGQGVITYASDPIVCWFTTLLDMVRVGNDFGNLRFTLGLLHRPIFSWKGSFIVAKAVAERKVSFDNGPNGSVAEDCFFALAAWREGYKFGFVEGIMLEKSAFSVADFVRQRKRWVQGVTLTFLSRRIPVKYKLGVMFMVITWFTMPLASLNLVFIPCCPLPLNPLLNFLLAFSGGVVIFLLILGVVKSFPPRRHGLVKCLMLILLAVITSPANMLLETMGVLLAVISMNKTEFHIIKKDIEKTIVSHV